MYIQELEASHRLRGFAAAVFLAYVGPNQGRQFASKACGGLAGCFGRSRGQMKQPAKLSKGWTRAAEGESPKIGTQTRPIPSRLSEPDTQHPLNPAARVACKTRIVRIAVADDCMRARPDPRPAFFHVKKRTSHLRYLRNGPVSPHPAAPPSLTPEKYHPAPTGSSNLHKN